MYPATSSTVVFFLALQITSIVAAPTGRPKLPHIPRTLNYPDRPAPCFPKDITTLTQRREYWVKHMTDESFVKLAMREICPVAHPHHKTDKLLHKRQAVWPKSNAGAETQKEAAGKPIQGSHVPDKTLEESKKKMSRVYGTARERSEAKPLLEAQRS
jgi:hypothetical protein